ncbi:CsoS2 family carboxysome shell protein [Litorivicinus sp.]|nr:CsoS2 family carboxysome shell protein [Litorivicinus sp.]
MSDSMTGKQLALARRQALSQGGKSALQPRTVKSSVGATSSESVPTISSAKERRRLMSQTGKAALPMTDRTRASTVANQSCDCESPPQQTKMRLSTRGGPPGVVEDLPGRIAAKARREALASDGKKALTGNQDGFGGSVSGRAAARALREERSRFGAKNLK